MALINYIVKALKPSIFCEDNILLFFLNSTDIFNDGIHVGNSKNRKYDIILTKQFDIDLYNLLNHDGFYFCTKGFGNVEKLAKFMDLEYIFYNPFCIIKKGGMLHWMLEKQEYNPIYLRNFGDTFNVVPYCKPFEIINHPYIIYNLCLELRVKSYLELGVRDCHVPGLIKSAVPHIVGVDVTPTPNFPGSFHNMTTDAYFEMCELKGDVIRFDMIFIDACHDYEQVKTDFNNSLKYLKVGGTILLHDTYPVEEFMTQPQWCSDSYKIVEYIRKLGLRVLNLPISPGLCIVQV